MRISRFVFPAAMFVAALAVPAAAEDLTIVTNVTGPQGTESRTQYYTDTRFRTASADGDMIFDTRTGAMTFVDTRKKQYWQTTQDEMNAAFEALSAQMKQMEEQMKGNPMAAQMMEKMMGGAGAPVKVAKGESPRTIAGYACEHWVVSMGQSMTMELWTTGKLKIPTGFYDARKAQFAGNPMLQRFAKAFDELQKMGGGFTLADKTTMSMMGRTMATSSEASEVKHGAIPDSAFEVPAGYKKVDSPMKQMQKGMK
jgi:hypothetical protein